MNQITDDYPFVFVDPKSVELFELSCKVASTDIPVLVRGPSGTGKEVLARVLHESSAHADQPFVALNCAAIPEHLVEDTLFGHEKGAFTGAHKYSMGFFEQASGGTLFLDEIGEMPLELQAKLLRVLQEKQIYRVGATTPVSVNVRIIAATNVDLKYNIQNRLFREDLYFRLSGFNLAIGRLADRPADIEPLARIFVQKHSGEQRSTLSQSALQKLLTHSWPGNVRELENVIARAMVLHENHSIEASDIAFDDLGLGEPMQAAESVSANYLAPNNVAPINGAHSDGASSRQPQRESSELHAILRALQASTNREQAAEQLGMSPRTLRQKLFEFRRAGHEVPRAYARS